MVNWYSYIRKRDKKYYIDKYNMKKYMFCNNCGKQGHLYHRCKKPISSIGVIAFRKKKNEENIFEYLMICRKDTLGFVDFMRGKYPLFNKFYISNIIDEMTLDEKKRLLNNDFKTLWENLWGNFVGCQYRGEEKMSYEKFEKIKDRITTKNSNFNLEDLIKESKTQWNQPEWGFPKGRRNYQENDMNCALREFMEETGFIKGQIKIIQNLMPFEEIFTGSNMKSYKHKYFVGYIKNSALPINDFQKSEVSDLKWRTLDKCLEMIRPYNLEKKEVIKSIDNVLHNYRLIL
jgi:8-oxo-dGTP pyrophosphatase MutT (NUDIX family)/ribosomal protein L32